MSFRINRGVLVGFSVGALLLALCTACGEKSYGSSESTIVVGQLTASSGIYGALSSDETKGREFAVEQINAQGGIDGKKIKLVTEDWRSETGQVVSKANQLFRDRIVALLGPDTSTATVLLDPPTAAAKVPMIHSGGLNPTGAYSFSVQPLDYFSVVMDFAKSRGATQICDLGVAGVGFESVQKIVHPAAQAAGLKVGMEIPFDPALPDLTPQVTKLKAAGCTAIFSGVSGSSLALVAKAMKKLGMTNVVLMSQGSNATPAILDQMGDTTAFTYFPIPKVALGKSIDPSDPVSKNVMPFVDSWIKKYGSTPNIGQALGVANVEVLAAALRSGAKTGPEIKRFLESGQTISTPVAPYSFSPTKHAGATTAGYYVMARWDAASRKFVLG
jgi:branched-chain amino acid transport system substrate-binding protein